MRVCRWCESINELLCGPLRISAFSALKLLINRRERRDTRRTAEKDHTLLHESHSAAQVFETRI